MDLPLDGRCRCDAVRVRLTEAPLMTAVCHCTGCKRMASSAFSLTAICPASALIVTKGEPVLGGLRGADLGHFFCGDCMTWMFSRPRPWPEVVNVRPTMFDDHAWFAPFLETYAKTKLPWVTTGAVRAFDEFPPMEELDGLVREYAAWRAGSTHR